MERLNCTRDLAAVWACPGLSGLSTVGLSGRAFQCPPPSATGCGLPQKVWSWARCGRNSLEERRAGGRHTVFSAAGPTGPSLKGIWAKPLCVQHRGLGLWA